VRRYSDEELGRIVRENLRNRLAMKTEMEVHQDLAKRHRSTMSVVVVSTLFIGFTIGFFAALALVAY
jgi:type III secretory pathway component EscT